MTFSQCTFMMKVIIILTVTIYIFGIDNMVNHTKNYTACAVLVYVHHGDI